MLLVDEGKVNLDDPVEKYLPEFTGQMVYRPRPAPSQTAPASMKPSDLVPADHPILVREMLSHTSGPPYIAPFLQRYVRLHLKLSRPSPSS
jgi:CubicO group peptidase (beta-lactamase class C family)